MLRFEGFESLGLRVAGISEASDGDCGHRGVDGAQGRARVAAGCGFAAERLVWGWQVHGTAVRLVGEAGEGPFADTDGVATQARGVPLGIFVADCVPVFLFDPRTRSGALVHAGREGTRTGIAAEAVRALGAGYGARAEDLHALIGPSAGPCCYEVSAELAGDFAGAGLPARGRYLDLWEGNAVQLVRAGVAREKITVSALCTICTDRFWSYRRDGTVCRNLAVMML